MRIYLSGNTPQFPCFIQDFDPLSEAVDGHAEILSVPLHSSHSGRLGTGDNVHHPTRHNNDFTNRLSFKYGF